MSATLEKGIHALKEVIDAPIASYFESCVHCSLLSEDQDTPRRITSSEIHLMAAWNKSPIAGAAKRYWLRSSSFSPYAA